jgi:hypothetical protein
MKTNKFAIIFITIFFLTGCTEPKDDFVGISFDTTQSKLESQGFICKKAKNLTCTSFDKTGSAFGYATKGVSVTYLEDEKIACCISVDLPPETARLKEILNLFTNIDSVYSHMPERDVKDGSMLLREWKRPDGSSLFLMAYEGVANIIPTTVSLTAHSQEWEKKAAASRAAEAASK